MRFSIAKNKILIFAFAVVFVFSTIFLKKEVKNFFYFLSAPMQKTLWRAGDSMSGFFVGLFQGKNLVKENEELKIKIRELLSENISLKEFKAENEFLRESLNIGLEKDFELKIADIVGKDVFKDVLLVNKGKKNGVVEGSPVITSQKVLVGRISEVFDNFSKIILISNKNSSFDAKIGGNDVYGIVKGKGHSEVWIELILKEKEVKIGDAVLTSALGGIFPKNLLVGEISQVQKSDPDLYQKAKITIGAEIKELKTIFIINQ